MRNGPGGAPQPQAPSGGGDADLDDGVARPACLQSRQGARTGGGSRAGSHDRALPAVAMASRTFSAACSAAVVPGWPGSRTGGGLGDLLGGALGGGRGTQGGLGGILGGLLAGAPPVACSMAGYVISCRTWRTTARAPRCGRGSAAAKTSRSSRMSWHAPPAWTISRRWRSRPDCARTGGLGPERAPAGLHQPAHAGRKAADRRRGVAVGVGRSIIPPKHFKPGSSHD